MSRLVLVTGAGFSCKAGVPTQNAVLADLLRYEPSGDIARANYVGARDSITEFLNAVFFQRGYLSRLTPEDEAKVESVSLEDVYTVLDKAITRRDRLPHYEWVRLVDVRRNLDLCVAQYLSYRESRYRGDDYSRLAERLVERYGYNWSTVTLNWDTVWDRALAGVFSPRGLLPDYGWSARYLNLPDGGTVRRNGACDVRLLKLHGSLNWLGCPRCRSLLVRPLDENTDPSMPPTQCPFCSPGSPGPHEQWMEQLLLTPTLMKAFENTVLNAVWDEALRVLTRAGHVIFVGYSFPLADHDLRYLLRRALSYGVKVTVVLHDADRPRTSTARGLRPLLPEARYRSFFGLTDTDFHYTGWEQFFEDHWDRL